MGTKTLKVVLTITMIIAMVVPLSACGEKSANDNPDAKKYVGFWEEDNKDNRLALDLRADYTGFWVEGIFWGERESIIWDVTDDGIEIEFAEYDDSTKFPLIKNGKNRLTMEFEQDYSFTKKPKRFRAKYDIGQYDFSGEYYEAYDERLEGYGPYDKMVMAKRGFIYNVSQEHGGFTLENENSGYSYGMFDMAVSVDIDRENLTMKLIEPSGYIADEFEIWWCDETGEYYFIDSSDTCWFKY